MSFNLSDKVVSKWANNSYYYGSDVKEFIRLLKEYKHENNKTVHRNSCGEPYWSRDRKSIEISCGDELDEVTNEFYQCSNCRFKDYIDELAGDELRWFLI